MWGKHTARWTVCDSCSNTLAAHPGDTNGRGYLSSVHVFWIINTTRRSCKWSTRMYVCMYGEREFSPRPLDMPSESVPGAPLEDSQSLFDLHAVLPAGRPRGCKQLFWSPISSHTFFPKDPEVLTHSCNGISYAKNRPDLPGYLNIHSPSFSIHHPWVFRIRYSSSRWCVLKQPQTDSRRPFIFICLFNVFITQALKMPFKVGWSLKRTALADRKDSMFFILS